MDPQVITDTHLVERYLLGNLSGAESRYLEQMLKQHPALLDRVDLTGALGRLERLLTLTHTRPPTARTVPRWCHPISIAALSIALVAAIGAGIGANADRRALLSHAAEAKALADRGSVLPPRSVSHLGITPVAQDTVPTAIDLGSRLRPNYTELRIHLQRSSEATFGLSIRRADHTVVSRIDRLQRDANGDIALALNIGLLPAGVYEWTVESETPQGNRQFVGWFRTAVAGP
jgi:hypothetical protein